jgi:hypothetical protein
VASIFKPFKKSVAFKLIIVYIDGKLTVVNVVAAILVSTNLICGINHIHVANNKQPEKLAIG